MTKFYFALSIPLNELFQVKRATPETKETLAVDQDYLCNLVAIANMEGLAGKEIVGVICKPNQDKTRFDFNFEYRETIGGFYQ